MSKLTPFKWFCMQNFPFIEADYDAVTDWQLLQQIGSQCKALTDAVIQIQEYLQNLDLQDEVNNKLDEMAESGELAEIIAQYLNLACLLVYGTKADLKSATNLVENSIAMTLGENQYNDGIQTYYKIRTKTESDVVDDNNILALTNSETLIAERVPQGTKLNVVDVVPLAKENDAEYDVKKFEEENTDTSLPGSEYEYVYQAKQEAIANEPNNILKVATWNLAINETFADYLFEGLKKHDIQRKVCDKLGCNIMALNEVNKSVLFPDKDIYLTELYKYINTAIGWDNYRSLMGQGEAVLSTIEPVTETHGIFDTYVTIHQAWQNVRIHYNEKTVSMYSVHFSYNGGNEARKAQIDELYDIIAEDTSEYKIIAGDFNFDLEEYADTMLADFLNDGYKLVNGGQYISRTMAIDEIMISGNIDIIESGMYTLDEIENTSDHRPVWAKLELK